MKYVFIFLVLFSVLVFAAPPEPINIKGFIKYDSGVGVENGWVVYLNNTNTSYYSTTEVYAPPIPQLEGSYSGVILGSVGDIIRVWVYNETNYGESFKTLQFTTEEINITINNTRSSETNVTIDFPHNNYNIQLTGSVNLTVNVSVIGSSGTGCGVSISYSNNIFTSESFADLGNINLGSIKQSTFNLTPTISGITDVFLNASCDSDDIIFDNLGSDTLYNLSVGDNIPPVINLISPLDNNTTVNNKNITFFYNVTDISNISNCSLYVDGLVNITDFNVSNSVSQNFSYVLNNGVYDWTVGCYDIVGNFGIASNFSINVSVYNPVISNFSIINPIALNPGINTSVNCSFLVTDLNNESDIISVNTTFSAFGALDNPNNFYSNNSCSYLVLDSFTRNYTCNYDLVHYAVNDTWSCNVTSLDVHGNSDNNSVVSEVLPLYSFDLSTSFLNYGNVTAGSVSSELEVNVSNTGNMNFSLYLWGYGGFDNSTGFGNSFVCPDNNISVGFHRYDLISSVVYSSKNFLTSSTTNSGLTVPKQTDSSKSINSTYWQMSVPDLDPIIGLGQCNGTVVFEAFT